MTIIICTIIILIHQQYIIRRFNLKIDDVLKSIDAHTNTLAEHEDLLADEQRKLGVRVQNLIVGIVHDNDVELTPAQEAEFQAIVDRQDAIILGQDAVALALRDTAKDPTAPIPAVPVPPPVETTPEVVAAPNTPAALVEEEH